MRRCYPAMRMKMVKKFEDAMEKIVGKKKKNHLMQLELDLSIPILKKYANIMAQISGIDEDVLIYELTLPDEEDENKDENEDFNIIPSKQMAEMANDECYDRAAILSELSL